MDLLRRTLLQSAVAIGTPPLILTRRAQAETFPARPVRLITGFAPGGPMDIVARILSGWLAPRLRARLPGAFDRGDP